MHFLRARFVLVAAVASAGLCAAVAAPDRPDLPHRTFVHPGLLNNRSELELVKSRIKAGMEPWRSQFQRMAQSRFAARTWVPHPLAVVDARSADADVEIDDATAAYTQALMGYFTGDEAYARNAAALLNAWSATLQRHTSKDRQAELVAAWSGSIFPLAAEILRASYPAWTAAEIGRFSAMLNRAFVPVLVGGNAKFNGNWELAMSNALLCIGAFNDDAATFDRGVVLWRQRVPAFFYLAADGDLPRRPGGTTDLDSADAIAAYWFRPARYFDGLCQETRRDYGHHVQEGLASLVNGAEIAWHQGLDLYGEDESRIVVAMEFHAGALLGRPVPPEYFPAGFVPSEVLPTWEIAYNHFHHRRRIALPNTAALLGTKLRVESGPATHLDMAWEGLTHAELDASVAPPSQP